MLGLTPDRRGLLPDADVKRIEELGTARCERYALNLVEKRVRTHDSIDGRPGR
jgi:alpha-L-fucosidase